MKKVYEFKVGDYVWTNDNYVGKILSIDKDKATIDTGMIEDRFLWELRPTYSS